MYGPYGMGLCMMTVCANEHLCTYVCKQRLKLNLWNLFSSYVYYTTQTIEGLICYVYRHYIMKIQDLHIKLGRL